MLQPEGKQQRPVAEHGSREGQPSLPALAQSQRTPPSLLPASEKPSSAPLHSSVTQNLSLSFNHPLWCMNGDLETLQRAWMRFASPPCPIQCCLEALKTPTCRVLAWKPQLLRFPALAALTSPSPWCAPEAHTSLEITLGLCFPSSRD